MTSKMDVIFILILLAVPSIYSTLTTDKVLAEDWNRHGPWIERYMHGDFTPFLEYFPSFHFLMIPFVAAMGDYIRFLQIPLGFLAGASIVLFARRHLGDRAAVIVGLILISSIDFALMSMGLWPQTLDYILIPLALCLVFEKKYIACSGILTYLMYQHLTGVFIFAFFLLYSLFFDKKFMKYLAFVLVLSIPVIITLYVPHLIAISDVIGGGTSNFADSGQFYTNEWYQYFVSPWWRFFAFSSVPGWILLFVAIKKSWTQRLDSFEKVMLLWIVAFSPLLLFSLMRGISYLIVPMALYIASAITRSEHGKKV